MAENNNLPATKNDAIAGLLSQEAIKKRFEQVLGKKAPGFMSSIISAVNANSSLKQANPMTIVASAAVAASLDLPINPSLGFAYIVPYKKDGQPIAQFQMGYKGFIQLGMRSGQYQTMNACEVYEGELITSDRFTGSMRFDESQRTSDTVIGYVAYFRLINGFEKYLYMTVEQIKAHAKKYSQSYDHKNGQWQKNFHGMALKTVTKMLLSKWGILSIEMQSAVQYDQATVKTIDGSSYEYVDGTDIGDNNIIDAESPETIEDPAVLLKAFDDSIPADIDKEILADFLTRTAEGNKSSVDQVKIEAQKQPEAFWRVARAYEKTEKAKVKGAKKAEEVIAMAPGECPENPGTTYTKEHCDKCEKRAGCPSWE